MAVPHFVAVGRKSCLQWCFGHFYLSVAMDEWKEQISPCYCSPGKNKGVDKRLSWLNTLYSWKWMGIQPGVWKAGRVKRVKGLGTPTGSQPVQFLNLFLHLQPVKRKHTDKYHERQHNSTAVFLQRAEIKIFTFSPVLPLKTRTTEPLFLAKLRFSPAFSWQWFCVAQIRNYARRMLWYSICMQY